MRKILIHPDDPTILFLINYRDVYKSENSGIDWIKIFNKQYYPWDDNNATTFDQHNGLFDMKISPWNDSLYYLAGSEVFQIKDSLGIFDTINLSQNIFLKDIDPGDHMINHPHRCEVSLHENFPGKVWFCYAANYIINGVDVYKLRIVKYDEGNNSFEMVLDTSGIIHASGSKLEFAVSPSDENTFYIGGVGFAMSLNGEIIPLALNLTYGDCWMHMDMRDMQLFSDSEGNDTIYMANDAGNSWGTPFELGQTGCGDSLWHWRSLFESIENGLNVTEFYGIGLSDKEPYLIAGGCQDLNDMLLDSNQWINFGAGDGSELVFDPVDPNIFYFTEWQNPRLFRTNTLGLDHDLFYGLGDLRQSSLIIPIEIDPLDPSVLYSGGSELLKFSGVNDFNQTVPDPDHLAVFSDFITDIEVIKNGLNQRRLFVSTMKKYDYNPSPPPSSQFDSCIFWSDNEIDFNDISINLDGCRYGFISDIEVDPYDPDQIWVCAAGYSKSTGGTNYQDSKVFRLHLPGNNWENFSQGLPAGLPVFKIRYIPQLGRLFAATDVGIFMRDKSDSLWYPYNTNLPLKIITDIEVNLPYHKIVAATYGRGLWETEIEDICGMTEVPMVIDSLVTWSDDILLKGDIIIQDGGTLEITDCVVFMPEHSRIIVEQGGMLIVDGGTITSSCQKAWGGIEAWGSNNYQNYTELFGMVQLINNAVISNSRVAFSNYCTECLPNYEQSGGIIAASDAIFMNNLIATNFHPFTNLDQGIEKPYRASFTRCIFEFNDSKPIDSELQYFIKMQQVSGIKFNGCDFDNYTELTGSQGEIERKYGSGIYSLGSHFYVDETCLLNEIPCSEYKQSTFSGLNYGIYAMGIDLARTIFVDHSNFVNNLTGIYLRGINCPTIQRSTFEIAKVDTSEFNIFGGLYLDFCTGYTVEENSFTKGTSGIGDTAYVFGIVVKDSGEEPNEIYNNTFTQVDVGIEALNHNRSEREYHGLILKCNEFNSQTFNNIVVTRTSDTINPAGIAKYQGSDLDVTSPAGNLFWINPWNQIWHYINNLERYPIIYTMHRPSSEIRVKPVNYTSETITLDSIPISFDKEEACPSHLSAPPPEPGTLKVEMEIMELKIDSSQMEVDTWVDGGNTEEVITDVTFSTPPEAYDLYSDLMLKSPYLSDTVLKESVEKEDVLTNTMIEDILVGNPQSAKSAKISDALDNKVYPLDEDQRENIDQGKFNVSAREHLEAKLANRIHSKAMIMNDIITVYLNDTVNSWAQDSLCAFLSDANSLLSNYQLSFMKILDGDSASAMSILTNTLTSFDLSAAQLSIHQQYEDFAQILASINSPAEWFNEPDSLSVQYLLDLSAEQTFPGTFALNILQFLDTLLYIEPFVIPDDQLKSSIMPNNSSQNAISKKEDFKMYPNPATNYYIVEYNLETELNHEIILQVLDVAGKPLEDYRIQGNLGHKIISTKGLKPGLYLCKFVINGKEKQTIKLSVIK